MISKRKALPDQELNLSYSSESAETWPLGNQGANLDCDTGLRLKEFIQMKEFLGKNVLGRGNHDAGSLRQ